MTTDVLGGIAVHEHDENPEALAGEFLDDVQVRARLATMHDVPAATLADVAATQAAAGLSLLDAPALVVPVALMRAAASWYLVPCLDALRDEVNAAWPNRDRASDGTIGDAAHQGTVSDHNPDGFGRVLALDLDDDGVPMAGIVRAVIGDERLQYVIYRRVIWSRSWGWKARAYTGRNPHNTHAHFSARHDHHAQAVRRRWLPASLTAPSKPRPPKPAKPRPPADFSPGVRALKLRRPYLIGDDVLYVQRFIGPRRCGRPDRTFGPKTKAGVRWYQDMRGIRVDGIVGPVTWRHMGVKWRG